MTIRITYHEARKERRNAMQAVLESRDLQDIARQVQMSVSGDMHCEQDNKIRAAITSYEISKITGKANSKVQDDIRRIVPSGKEYQYETIFVNGSSCRYKAIALTEKGLESYIKSIESRGKRITQKQIMDIEKIKEVAGISAPKMSVMTTMPEIPKTPMPERRQTQRVRRTSDREQKIREAVENLAIAESTINVVEDRFIGKDYENLTYQQRDDFERLFYFMTDMLHDRIGKLKALMEE